jgi:hypothetical protein
VLDDPGNDFLLRHVVHVFEELGGIGRKPWRPRILPGVLTCWLQKGVVEGPAYFWIVPFANVLLEWPAAEAVVERPQIS